MCSRLPTRHSLQVAARRLDFGEQNVEALPYPPATGLLPFGTVFQKTHWQALEGLSWLSSSRPSVLPRVPEFVRLGSACHQAEAPHASQVERANRHWPEPPWKGFEAQMRLTPSLHQDGLKQVEVCPHRPHSLTTQSDRVPGLLESARRSAKRGQVVRATCGLLRQASVEPDKHLSAYPALRATTLRLVTPLP